MNDNPNSLDDERSQDFWEDNANASSSFQYPFFDECPFLRSEMGNFLIREIDRRIKLNAIRLAAVIASLPEDQRRIYLLYTHERKPFRDIAAILGQPDHQWVRRRFMAASAAVEKAMPRPMGHAESGCACNSAANERPKAPCSKEDSGTP